MADLPVKDPRDVRFRVNLFWKIFLATLIASLVPVLLVTYQSSNSINEFAIDAEKKASELLDEKSVDAVMERGQGIAAQVESLLNIAVQNTLTLAELEPDSETYQAFSNRWQREITYLDKTSGKRRIYRVNFPLYREITFINTTGQEQIRIVDEVPVPQDKLVNVSDPANTTYGNEKYFSETIKLANREVYVSPVTARYVTFQKGLEETSSVENSAFAFINYVGLIRFATPVYNEANELQGIVVLSLDHRHVMELVNHVKSLDEYVPWPDYDSGEYAYLVDYEGWLIAHAKLTNMRGLDERGELMPSLGTVEREGPLPFNMILGEIVKPESKEIADDVLAGNSGTLKNYNLQGALKVDAYVPIKFNHGVYKQSGVFGGVVFSESLQNVEEASNAFAGIIENTRRVFQSALIQTTIIGVIVLISAVVLVSRNITVPIVQLTGEAHAMEKGEYDVKALDLLLGRRIEDEVTDLSRVFKQMAKAIKLRETRLKDEIRQLRIEIDEQKKQEEVRRVIESESFQQLQAKAATLRARRALRQQERQRDKPEG